MVSAEKVVCLYEKLLKDDSTKDVEIEMSDGTLMAHSSILRAGGDAMEGLLTNGAAASSSLKRLAWKEYTKTLGQFFLRLLYTGTVDAQEWGDLIYENPYKEAPDLLEITVASATAVEGVKKCAGTYELVPDMRPNGKPMWKHREEKKWVHFAHGLCSKVWCVRDSQDQAPPDASAVRGYVVSHSCEERMPHEIDVWRYFDGTTHVADVEKIVIQVTEPEQRVPLALLIGSLAIARMYLFQDLVEVLVPALKSRLSSLTFDAISQAAIKTDTQSLRVHCLQFAQQDSNGVRPMYESDLLSPEVKTELTGVWHSDPPLKRRKL